MWQKQSWYNSNELESQYVVFPTQSVFRPDTSSSFVLHLSSFLKCFQDTLHTTLRYAKFSANSSLRITLLLQKHYFLTVKVSVQKMGGEKNNQFPKKSLQKAWRAIAKDHFKRLQERPTAWKQNVKKLRGLSRLCTYVIFCSTLNLEFP